MKNYEKKVQIPAYLLVATIMVIGYFLTKWYLKQSMAIALTGITENIFQYAVGVVIALICYPMISRIYFKNAK